jgi:hypothetical protein
MGGDVVRTCAVATWLAGLLASTALGAMPAHYVVFTLDGHDRARPVYYARVELADAPRHAGTSAASADEERVAWHAWKGGVDLGERSVAIPLLHGEFARDPEHGDGSIVAHHPAQAERSFVLRIPFDDADAIEFSGAGMTQRFELAALAAQAQVLPLASLAAEMQVVRPPLGGNSANRVDMLVMGDGYTGAQQGLFNSDAMILHDAFFNLTPYKEYQSFVNWTTGFVASNQSGADHPPYQAGCTTSTCCADPEAQSDPFAGQFVDTAFSATFCPFQIHRLVTVSNGAVLAAAAAYPDWDKIVIVVNDSVYGGSGGNLSVTSTHPQANQIVLHEYGHSFSKLADEYSSPYPGFPACSDISGSASCEANVTNQVSPGLVKWSSWFTPGNPIPTPAGTPGVGLFQGARYLSTGMYRPADTQCMMQFLGMPFCPVCRQEYVRTLYRGGWGVPASGIDLIEPGSESPGTAVTVDYAIGTTLPFSATLLQPSIGTLDVQWLLDGNPIGGANSPSYAFSQAGPMPTTRTLVLRVRDQTGYVSPQMAGALLEHTRSWTIHVSDDVIFRNGFDAAGPLGGSQSGLEARHDHLRMHGEEAGQDPPCEVGDRSNADTTAIMSRSPLPCSSARR